MVQVIENASCGSRTRSGYIADMSAIAVLHIDESQSFGDIWNRFSPLEPPFQSKCKHHQLEQTAVRETFDINCWQETWKLSIHAEGGPTFMDLLLVELFLVRLRMDI